MYFKISEFNKNVYKYLKDFWENELRPTIIRGSLNYSKIIRHTYSLIIFKQMMKKEMDKYNTMLRQISKTDKRYNKVLFEKKFYENLYRVDNGLFNNLLEYKENANLAKNEYNIPIEDINYMLGNDYETLENNITDNIIDHKYIDGKICIKWKTLVELIALNMNIDGTDRRKLIKYMTSIEEIYEFIITEIQSYMNCRLETSIQKQDMIEVHIMNKQKQHYGTIFLL